MNILLIGSGGREHALAWAISRSPRLKTLFIAPGNPGTGLYGANVSLNVSDHAEVLEFVKKNNIGLTVVGPEQPLVEGLADALNEAGFAVFGPSAKASQLEGSKSFAKNLMQKYDIPTAGFQEFDGSDRDAIETFAEQNQRWPVVFKADGLAAGKGVFICRDLTEARNALQLMQVDDGLKKASAKLVVEEFMEGEEVSVFAVCDGKNARILGHAQDHKRIGDGDTGLNTGGMGAYSPAPLLYEKGLETVRETIIDPVIKAMAAEGMPYTGILYCGLMMTKDGPKVVEFNCRFGDPEAQVILPRLKTDIVEVMTAATKGGLDQVHPELNNGYYTCVVLASEGYPRAYEKGKKITGIPAPSDSLHIFHCGTAVDQNGDLLTNGGRVLNVVAQGNDLKTSIDKAYDGVLNIHFDGMYYRKDIGSKGLQRL